MDVRNWKRVLLLWMSEFDYTNKSTSNVEQSDVEAFFEHVRSNHKTLLQREKDEVQLIQFLSEHYSAFHPHVDDQNEMSSADYVYVYSLLLHFTCVKQPEVYFQEKCNKLPESAQKAIALFFKLILECSLHNKENLRHIIGEVANACQLKSSPCGINLSGSPSSPMKTPTHARISPSTPKTIMLDERTRELINLRTELENERYEKSLLEIQIKENDKKISKLNNDCKRLQHKLMEFKTAMNGNDNANENYPSSLPDNEEQEPTKRRLIREIKEKEAEISKLTDMITTLRDEKTTLKEQLNQAEKHIKICMDRIQESDCKIFELTAELHEQSSTIKFLNEHRSELERFINEIRSAPTANNSSDCLDVSFQNVSSSPTTSPENLGCSVIDKQLREKTNEVNQLREELNKIRCNNVNIVQNIKDLMEMEEMQIINMSNCDKLLEKEVTENSNALEYLQAFGKNLNEFTNSYNRDRENFCKLQQNSELLCQKNEELNERLSEAEEKINDLNTKVDNMEIYNEDLLREKAILEMSLNQCKHEITELNQRKYDLVAKYECLLNEYDIHKESCQSLQLEAATELGKLQAQVMANEQLQDHLKQHNDKLERELNDLQFKLQETEEDAIRRSKDYKYELQTLTDRLLSMKAEYDKHHSMEIQLKENHDKLLSQTDILKKNAREADAHLSAMRAKLHEKEREMFVLGEEINKVRSANIEKESRIENLVAGFKSERERMTEKLKCNDFQYQHMVKVYEQLERLHENLKKEIVEKNELLVDQEKELQSTSNKLADVSQSVLVPLIDNELALSVHDIGNKVRDLIAYKDQAQVLIDELRNENELLQGIRLELETNEMKQKDAFERQLQDLNDEKIKLMEEHGELLRKSKEEMCMNFCEEREHYIKVEKELQVVITKYNEALVNLKKAEDELKEIQNEKEKYSKNLELLEKEKLRFQKLADNKNKELEEMRKQLLEVKNKLSAEKEKAKALEGKLTEREEELTQKKQKVKQLLGEQGKYSKQLEAHVAQQNQLEKERNANAEELKIAREQSKVHKQQLDSLKKEFKQKILEMKLIESERNNKVLENTQMEMEHNKKVLELKQSWDRRSKTQQMDIEHWQRKAHMLTDEVEQYQQEIAKIEKKHTAETEEKLSVIRGLEKSLEQMQLSVTDKKLTSEKLMNEIEEKEQELIKEKQNNGKMEKELKGQVLKLKEEIAALKEELQNEKDAMVKLNISNKDLEKQLAAQREKTNAEIAEWKEKFGLEQDKLKRVNTTIKELEKRLAEQEQKYKEETVALTEKMQKDQERMKRLSTANKEFEKRLATQDQKSKEHIAILTEEMLKEQDKWRHLNTSIKELEKRLAVQDQKAKEKIDILKEEILKEQDKVRILTEVNDSLKRQVSSQEDIAKKATEKMNSITEEVNLEHDVIKRFKHLNTELKRQLMTIEEKSRDKIAALTAELQEEQNLMSRLDGALTSIIVTLENVTNLAAESEQAKEDYFKDTRDLPELKRCLNKVVYNLKQKELDIIEMEKQKNSECKILQMKMETNLAQVENQLKETNLQLEEARMRVQELKERQLVDTEKIRDQERMHNEMRKFVQEQVCDNKQLEKNIMKLQEKLRLLESSNEEFFKEIEKLKENNQAGVLKEEELSKDNTRLRDELKKWQEKLLECESKVLETMEARIELDKMLTQNEEEDKRALQVQQELSKLMQERNLILENDVSKYLMELEKLGLDNSKYKENHEAQTKRIEKLSLKLGETQAHGDKLERELNRANEMQAKFEYQNQMLKIENDTLKKDSNLLKERVQQLEELQSQLANRISNLAGSLKKNEMAQKKLLEEHDELSAKIVKLEKQREANDEKIHELQAELINAENETVRLQLENGALNSELVEIKRHIKENENMKNTYELECENLRELMQKSQLALEIAQQEKLEYEQQLLTLRAEKSNMEEEYKLMLQKLQEAGKLGEERSQALEKQKHLIEELQEQLLVKKNNCDDMQEKITQLMSSEVQKQSTFSTELEHLRVRLTSAEELLEKELQITAQLRTDNQILQAKYAEAKLRLQEEHHSSEERIKENRLELEGKLEKMKMKMKTLYSEEISRMKSRQERETMALKTEIEKLKLQNTKYEEHTRKLSTQIMRMNDNIMEQQRQRAILSTKIKHLEESEDMRFKRPSSMHIPTAVTAAAPSSNLGSNLTMEDEEGEIFNNTYLTDLKTGRMSDIMGRNICTEELQYRNSLLPPHLKSTYAAQYDNGLDEDELKDGPSSFDDSMSGLLTGGGVRKKISGATHYKRPGPPTPSKNGGRLSLGGNSEPPREILKEYNNGGLSTVKTPARFGFFGSRFSMGKDEKSQSDDNLCKFVQLRNFNDINRAETEVAKKCNKSNKIARNKRNALCTSTPRKSKSYSDKCRQLEKLLKSSPSRGSVEKNPDESNIETPVSTYDIEPPAARKITKKLGTPIAVGRRRGQYWKRRLGKVGSSSTDFKTPNNDDDDWKNDKMPNDEGHNHYGRIRQKLRRGGRPSLNLCGNMFANNRTQTNAKFRELNRAKSHKQRRERFHNLRQIPPLSSETETLSPESNNYNNNNNNSNSNYDIYLEKNIQDIVKKQKELIDMNKFVTSQDLLKFDMQHYQKDLSENEDDYYDNDYDDDNDDNYYNDNGDNYDNDDYNDDNIVQWQDLEHSQGNSLEFERLIKALKSQAPFDVNHIEFQKQNQNGSEVISTSSSTLSTISAAHTNSQSIDSGRLNVPNGPEIVDPIDNIAAASSTRLSNCALVYSLPATTLSTDGTATHLSRTIYGGSVIFNRRIPNVSSTYVRKSSIYVKNNNNNNNNATTTEGDTNDIILVTDQTITIADLIRMWQQMNRMARSIVLFALTASLCTIYLIFIKLFISYR